MYTDTEGIVLRQVKTANGRRMILLFTKAYGKISAGTSINEGGKNKTALALRPFTLGRYELYKGRETFSLNGAETIDGHYGIGEDIDKFMAASYVLELTEKLALEDTPMPSVFTLVTDFLKLLEGRKKSIDTLLVAYMLKMLVFAGCAPNIKSCMRCNSKENHVLFSIPAGGVLCGKCVTTEDDLSPLCYKADSEMLSAMDYILGHPLTSLENLSLKEDLEIKLLKILKAYYSYHLGIENLKSEGLKI